MTHDPFEQAIQTTLRERYGDPPAVERLWARVAPALTAASPPHSSPRRTGFLQRWGQWGTAKQIAAIVIPLVLVMALVGGTALAVNNNLWGVFTHDQGAGSAYIKKLGKAVSLTQAHQGYTMTISWVYSDSIRTIVGYNITGPAGHNFKSFDFTATDVVMQTDDGRRLPLLNSASGDVAHGTAPAIASFDASALSLASGTLSLHLTLTKFVAEDDVNNASTYTPITIDGPLHFDYTTPYYVGQTITTPQTMTDHGRSVTLARVVVSPSAAQASLKLGFPITGDEKFTGGFIAPDGAGNLGTNGGVGLRKTYDPATGIVVMTSMQVSSQNPGQWSLGVQLSQLDQIPNPTGGKPTGDGTLFQATFSFIVK